MAGARFLDAIKRMGFPKSISSIRSSTVLGKRRVKMYTKFVLLSLVAFSFWRFGVKAEGFNPAMDYWRQMSSTLDHKQYKSLHDLVDQNSDTTKSELEEKVGEWAKQNGLEVSLLPMCI